MSDNLYNYESDTSDDEFNCIYKEFEYLESKKKRRRKRILGYESDSGDSDGDESDHRFSEKLQDKKYCVAILKSGKNKGKVCGIRKKPFMYDFSLCGHHLRAYHTSGFITIKRI